jgi:Flavin containing amine oxidoreductase
VNLSALGDGTVKGILSVDISEWEEKGLNGKTAKECTNEEIKTEVWEQLKRSLNYGDNVILRDDQLLRWSLDPDIRIREGADGATANEEPLLVNLVDTWKLRPEAVTKIPNLFLASDYVRTNTDLATMEAANEAARRAVNGILKASGSDALPCPVWDLHEPEIFAPWRELDAIRYARGLPWDDTLVKVGLSVAEIVDKAIVALERGSETHDVFERHGNDLATGPEQIFSLLDRNPQRGFTSDLRRDATSLLERLGKIVALRLAEAQSAAGRGTGARSSVALISPQGDATPARSNRRASTGNVHIVPR